MHSTLTPNRRLALGLTYVGVFVISIATAWLMGKNLILGAGLTIVAVGGLTILAAPSLGLFAAIATLVIGQLIRIPLGAEGAVLPSDIIVPVFIAAWLLRSLLRRHLGIPRSPLAWPIATMAVVFVLTFLLGATRVPFLSTGELLKSSFYMLRWFEYAFLVFVIADIIRTETQAMRVLAWLFGAAVAIAVLGFIQLKLFPDFRFMVPKGWDPHIGRLLSTWFDPNFLAGFLSFVLCLVAGIASTRKFMKSIVLWLIVSVLFAAIVLTFSRSGYAAFLAGVIVLTLLRSRRMFLLLCVVIACSIMFIPRVQERVQGAFDVDDTAKLRIVSWQNAFSVVRDFPVTGIGYNTYRYVQVNYGFQKDAAEHSAGGSDSSLLTFLVTAGPIGLLTELWILWASASLAWTSYRRGKSELIRGLGVGAFAGLAGVVAHSFFINSLLLPHMMLTMAVGFGVLIGLNAERLKQEKSQ